MTLRPDSSARRLTASPSISPFRLQWLMIVLLQFSIEYDGSCPFLNPPTYKHQRIWIVDILCFRFQKDNSSGKITGRLILAVGYAQSSRLAQPCIESFR